MRLVTKITAGILLGIGLPISLLAVNDLVRPNVPESDRQGSLAALMFFGLPPAAVGGWLIWNGQRKTQQERRDRLRSIFFRSLQESKGSLTVLKFAMDTGLDGESARSYLDQRAKEYNASFNVTEEGKLSYYFDVGDSLGMLQESSSEAETFDVILQSFPANKQRQVVKEIRDLMGVDWKQAKALLKQPEPVVLRQGVSRPIAEDFRRRLEAAGADVLVVLK